MADGWDALDEISKPAEKLPDGSAPDVIDKLYVEVFNTPAGVKLLAYWRKHFLEAPVCVPGAGAEVGFHREGQNALVRECRQRFIRGTTPKT